MSQFDVLEEPELEFGGARRFLDPRLGMALFGPYDRSPESELTPIRYGVVGHPAGLEAWRAFASRVKYPIATFPPGRPWDKKRTKSEKQRIKEALLWPPYPGISACLGCTLPIDSVRSKKIEPEAIEQILENETDPYKRAANVVERYLEAIRIVAESEERPAVIICVEPDLIWKRCRPQSTGRVEQEDESDEGWQDLSNQLGMFPDPEPDSTSASAEESTVYDFSRDFRRQLKARSMEFNIPVQLIRESTFIEDPKRAFPRQLTVLSDRAWNITTALYYKCGGKPWRLATARPGVCYVGLAYKVPERSRKRQSACSAAQMFLSTGDGIVFRGANSPQYSPDDKMLHLDKAGATELLRGVLKTYEDYEGQPITEVFVHSRSDISAEEFEGFVAAVRPGVKVVAVRVQRDLTGIRLLRNRPFPVMRGTFWRLDSRHAFLWTSGFKPTSIAYDGWTVPVPLRVDIQHGDSEIEVVARDIFGLTKLNYNTCKLGDSMPVTVKYSDKVGEILVTNPGVSVARPQFAFYI